MGQSIRTILWSSAVRWKSRKQIGGLKCRPGCSTGRHALTPGFSQFYSECSKFGASEENRTPDSQIRRLGPSTLNARGSRSDHNFLRRATARQKSRSDPRHPGLPVSRNRPRPTLAGGLHMPPSRRTAEAGFKDSAVKKLACLPRIRPSPGAAMVTTWPARGPPSGSPPRFSTVRIRWLEKYPVLLGFSPVAIRWRRGRDSHPRFVGLPPIGRTSPGKLLSTTSH
jgi:hypothetical protein